MELAPEDLRTKLQSEVQEKAISLGSDFSKESVVKGAKSVFDF